MAYHIEEMGEFSKRDIRNMVFTTKESEAVTFGEQATRVVMKGLQKANKHKEVPYIKNNYYGFIVVNLGKGNMISRLPFPGERKRRYLKSW